MSVAVRMDWLAGPLLRFFFSFFSRGCDLDLLNVTASRELSVYSSCCYNNVPRRFQLGPLLGNIKRRRRTVSNCGRGQDRACRHIGYYLQPLHFNVDPKTSDPPPPPRPLSLSLSAALLSLPPSLSEDKRQSESSCLNFPCGDNGCPAKCQIGLFQRQRNDHLVHMVLRVELTVALLNQRCRLILP